MMRCTCFRVLATHALLLILPRLAFAQDELTTTTTLTSTTTILTTTVTLTSGGTSFTSTMTETTAVAGDPSMPTNGPVATGAMSYTGGAFQAAVLNSTNYYRSQHQAQALSWDENLASYAQDYAEKCQWQHSVGADVIPPQRS
jgi:uncharacterized protein YkwD